RLRPTILDDAGLHAALLQHLTEWSGRTGIEVDFEADAVQTLRLSPEIETACYRQEQEALTNVDRHAEASKVSVVISRHCGWPTIIRWCGAASRAWSNRKRTWRWSARPGTARPPFARRWTFIPTWSSWMSRCPASPATRRPSESAPRTPTSRSWL